VRKLSSQNKDAVRVTLSKDSQKISENMQEKPVMTDTMDYGENQTIGAQNINKTKDMNENSESLSEDEQTDAKKIDKSETETNEITTETDDDPVTTLQKKENENSDLQDRLLRLSAEFENFKKRNRREMSEFKKFAAEMIIKELLPVVDNLERALDTATSEEACKAINEGVAMTRDEMLKVFSRYGVQPIEALDQPFDPSYHQAVGQEENSEKEKNTILKEYQKGYTMHGRLLRPSMVIVSN